MTMGMMWLDDDKQRSFEEKVRNAVAYCQSVRGYTPTVVQVNAKLLASEEKIDGIEVKPVNNILLHHFYLIRGDS